MYREKEVVICSILSVGDVKHDCVGEECEWWDKKKYTGTFASINKYMNLLTKDGFYDIKDIIKAID